MHRFLRWSHKLLPYCTSLFIEANLDRRNTSKEQCGNIFLTFPPYVLAVIPTFLNSLHAHRTGERFFHVVIPLCFGFVAFIIAASTTAFAPRYFAMMLMPAGVYTGYVVCLAWISNSLPPPPVKRAAALALIKMPSATPRAYMSVTCTRIKMRQDFFLR
jgi:hypothetical protein